MPSQTIEKVEKLHCPRNNPKVWLKTRHVFQLLHLLNPYVILEGSEFYVLFQ